MRLSFLSRQTTLTCAACVALVQAVYAAPPADYVAHEWGTFTSIQGSDGTQNEWQSPSVAELPGFVYDWTKPGYSRVPERGALGGKGGYTAKQRMETPVIYFYADGELAVDVTVQFPRGIITEWYPQAYQVGPSHLPTNFQARPTEAYATPDSRIRWAGLILFPAKAYAQLNQQIPNEKSASHYFAARGTDSDFVSALPDIKSVPEHEKFLFYRGVGQLTAPLKVMSDATGALTLRNTGPDRLTHLFVFENRDGRGTLIELNELAPNESRAVVPSASVTLAVDALKTRLEQAMAEALASEGLYHREASAMVNTWKDSWFDEEGLRVLYVLPRSWTDATLPLTLVPAPRDLVRVMVARAEIISLVSEKHLRDEITRAGENDRAAGAEVAAEMKKLGRFSATAWQLATRDLDATLLRSASQVIWPQPAPPPGSPGPQAAIFNQ